jgi:hypothetical protein
MHMDTQRDIRIVVLQRGWVAAGVFSQDAAQCRLNNAFIVRQWGTTAGLGQLAKEGPLQETILDPAEEIRFHELSVVCAFTCSDKWEPVCR